LRGLTELSQRTKPEKSDKRTNLAPSARSATMSEAV
jgi:hypothetical protein